MHFKLPKQKESTPKALSREDFEKLRDVVIPEKRISVIVTRDLFLFACYTGTAYADTVSVTHENLFTDDDGSLWLKYRRKKNELKARVKLLPEAIALIDKYKDDTKGNTAASTTLPYTPCEHENPACPCWTGNRPLVSHGTALVRLAGHARRGSTY